MFDSLVYIGKNAAIYGIGRAAGSVLSLLALPVLTIYLSSDEFGVVALLTMLGFVAESLFGLTPQQTGCPSNQIQATRLFRN